MAGSSLEERVAALEEEVALLKAQSSNAPGTEKPWWEQIFGTFANDRMFDEAMELGRQYRLSLREDDHASKD